MYYIVSPNIVAHILVTKDKFSSELGNHTICCYLLRDILDSKQHLFRSRKQDAETLRPTCLVSYDFRTLFGCMPTV